MTSEGPRACGEALELGCVEALKDFGGPGGRSEALENGGPGGCGKAFGDVRWHLRM